MKGGRLLTAPEIRLSGVVLRARSRAPAGPEVAGPPALTPAELVGVSECLYARLLACALLIEAVALGAGIAMAPFASSPRPVAVVVPAALAAALVGWALARQPVLYRALRSAPALAAIPSLALVGLMAVGGGQSSPLYPALCVAAAVPAVVGSRRLALSVAAAVVVARLAIETTAPDTVGGRMDIGQQAFEAVALLTWALLASVLVNRFVGFVLAFNTMLPPEAVRSRSDSGPRPAPRRPSIAQRANGGQAPAGTGRRVEAELTPRQLQVALLLAEGMKRGEIASRLGISIRTVDQHLSDIKERLGVRTRTGIVAELCRARLIQPASGPI